MAAQGAFISYSHADRRWLQLLHKHLAPAVRRGLVIWDDSKIDAGADWSAEIERAIARCKAAVLLVSPDFLASEFIQTRELPPLLDAHADGRITALWIHLSACDYGSALGAIQGAHDVKQPLDALPDPQRGAVLVEICRRIENQVAARADGGSPGADAVAAPGTPASHGPDVHYALVLSGTISQQAKPLADALLAQLQSIARDPRLTLVRIESGSIRLTLAGSWEGFDRLQEAFLNGELASITGHRALGLFALEAGLDPSPTTPRSKQEITMRLPKLQPEKGDTSPPTDSVVLAVYAPFGADEVLSTYPDGTSKELAQHPLFQGLLKVAAQRVHVVALIDLEHDDTYLVEIDAGRPQDVRVSSRWKQAMNEPRNLAGFLLHAHNAHPSAAVVLALEGHGAGFLPDLDPRQITIKNVTENGSFEWHLKNGQSVPQNANGSPVLPMGSPTLPMGSPTLPGNQSPLSTWGLGEALRMALAAGVPKLPVIHFNNCFNLSVELMHTIAAQAHYATGYANYNFFTAGVTYADVFERLRSAGAAGAEDLALWFALANRKILADKGNHPTMGGVVPLARMREVGERIDDLADALLAAMRTATPANRPLVIGKIKTAITKAQQYDSDTEQELETPDEMTDIRSLAHFLQKDDFGASKVVPAAQALEKVLAGIQRYGDNDHPWTDLSVRWNFDPKEKRLAMNIFLPDPLRLGVWDWRSPYYLTVNPDPNKPRVQPHIIDFVKVTDWVDFLIEYHKDVKFVGILAPSIPVFPVFNASFEIPKDDGDDDECHDDTDGPGNPDGPVGTVGGDKPSGPTSN